MKNNELHNTLEALRSTPAITPTAHQRHLKQLLQRVEPIQQSPAHRFMSTFAKSLGGPMKHNKKISFSLGVALVAAVIVGSFGAYSLKYSPHAHADALLNTATAKVSTLTPAERAQLDKAIGGNLEQSLADAKAAPDLHIISASMAGILFDASTSGASTISVNSNSAQTNQPELTTVPGSADSSTAQPTLTPVAGMPDMSKVKPGVATPVVLPWNEDGNTYLAYTGTNGALNVLVISKDNIPTILLSR